MKLQVKENRERSQKRKKARQQKSKNREQQKLTKIMSEHAFKEWCIRKKSEARKEKKLKKDQPLSYEDRERQWRKRNIEMSKKSSKVFKGSLTRKKSKRRSSKKEKSDN